MTLHLGHVPTPLATAGSSIAIVIQALTREHTRSGGRTSVAVAVNRDFRVAGADNLETDYSAVCPREWFTRREYLIDAVIGRLGLTRPFGGHMQDPAIDVMRRAQPDVVLVHEGHYAAATLPQWRRRYPDVRVFLYVHNHLSRTYGSRELWRLLRNCNGLIFVSQQSKKEFLDRHGPRGIAMHVVHNGVATDVFHDVGRTKSDRLRITFVGQVTEFKGVDLMIEAIARSSPRVQKAYVRIVGSSAHMRGMAETPFESQLRRRVEQLGLETEFQGYVSQTEVAALLRESDIVCVPSRVSEAFGMVALEAMASGAVVVASNRGGLPEACGGAGLLVDPEDIPAFANALGTLVDAEELHRRQLMGLRRARAASWATSHETLISVLTE